MGIFNKFTILLSFWVLSLNVDAQDTMPEQDKAGVPVQNMTHESRDMAEVSHVGRVPDYEEIAHLTSDPRSPLFYDSLMMRYKAGDTTLRPEDYHYLYYGFTLQDEYDPLVPVPAEEAIVAVFERSAEPDHGGLMEIIARALEVMERDPFSPANLNYLSYAYGALGDTLSASINHDRFVKVLDVIVSSGDGLKEQSPIHIIRFSHGADYMAVRGLEVAKRIVISRDVEFMELAEKDGKTRGYYFDYGRIYSKRPSQLPENAKHGMKFGDIPSV